MNRTLRNLLLVFSFFLLFAQKGFTELHLSRLISDGMILQRDIPVKIWGWANAREKVTLSFISCRSGLMSKDGMPVKQFAIAGADRRFVWATAEIRGNKVFVYCDDIFHPEIVRYAWSDNPYDVNLYNKEGLPALPFTTENQ